MKNPQEGQKQVGKLLETWEKNMEMAQVLSADVGGKVKVSLKWCPFKRL